MEGSKSMQAKRSSNAGIVATVVDRQPSHPACNTERRSPMRTTPGSTRQTIRSTRRRAWQGGARVLVVLLVLLSSVYAGSTVRAQVRPNDPLFTAGWQWALENVG